MNLQSLETVATIRQEYPDVDIIIVDENKKNWIQNKFGDEIYKALLK